MSNLSYYKKNLNLLKQRNKNLAIKIDNNNFNNDDFEIISSDKPSLKIRIEDKKKLVHSKYRPVVQAKRKIDSLEFKKHNLIGIAGIGCGYYIEEILRKAETGSRFIVFINRPDILKGVMKYRDLEKIFTNKKLYIIDGTDNNYINILKTILGRIDFVALAMGNVHYFKTPILKEKEAVKYQEFQEQFFSTISFLSTTFGNSSEDTLIGVDNILDNIETVLKSKDISQMNKFEGEPAVLVAAGPSLDKNIDVLKKYQDKVLIISCDTALKKLLNNGIKPDIVSVLERVEKVYDYFFKKLINNNSIPEDLTLVAEGVTYPKVVSNFPGQKSLVFRNNVPTENWFAENIDDLYALDTGNSVANLNFGLAHALGASPIILIGQDLAYSPDGKAHTVETGYDDFGDSDLVQENKRDIVEVEGYNGEKLKSKKWWKVFKQWFELKIQEFNVHCIDATEGGAYIKGTEVMKLQEAAEKYFDGQKPDFYNELKMLEAVNVDYKYNKFISAYEKLISDINSIKDEMKEIREEIPELHSKIKFDEKLEGLMQRFNDIDLELNKLYFENRFIYFVLQPVFLNMKKLKIKIDNREKSTVKRFKNLYANHHKKLIQSEKIINKTLELLESHLKIIKNKYS